MSKNGHKKYANYKCEYDNGDLQTEMIEVHIVNRSKICVSKMDAK